MNEPQETESKPEAGLPLGAPITIVYEIKDESEWQKTNPLKYEHNGLKAHTVAAYDAVEERNAFREELLRLRDVVCNEDVENIDRVLSAPNAALGGWTADINL